MPGPVRGGALPGGESEVKAKLIAASTWPPLFAAEGITSLEDWRNTHGLQRGRRCSRRRAPAHVVLDVLALIASTGPPLFAAEGRPQPHDRHRDRVHASTWPPLFAAEGVAPRM